ncbi:MAG TPA: MlaD family protein [Acetobacteraceae bacterium]|nr:MlaD family protein [Acetobacteraceae bacterium]
MSDQPHSPGPPPHASVRSKVDRRWRLSLIWAIPIVTLALGLWLAWHTMESRGPIIHISFESAEGLVAGQSHVKHKDVDMGVVQNIALSKNLQHVVVTVRMTREAEPLLTDRTKFWVVKPRFFAGALSGLETLVSGSYIEMLPSPKPGERTRNFTGLETPPVLQSDVPGKTFLLHAPRLGSISLGSPVFYRDLDVGEVLGWDIGDMASTVTVHAFVRAPYDKYVHDNSRFWNASGAKISLGGNGVQLQLESLRAVVLGGIAFETPDQGKGSPVTRNLHEFPLYPDKQAADSANFAQRISCITYLTGSVAGLAPGASVTLHGLPVGQVESVMLKYDKKHDTVVVPVRFDLEPGRVSGLTLPSGSGLDAEMRDVVRRGLRVSLESTNLITGQKQLAIALHPDAPPATLEKQDGAYVIPVAPGGSGGDLSGSATELLAKLNAIPFGQIGHNLNQLIAGANGLVNNSGLQKAVGSLQGTMGELQGLVHRLNTASGPLVKDLPGMARQLDGAVKQLNGLAASMQQGYGSNSDLHNQLSRLLAQLNDTAQSFRAFADLLQRHPEALIRGRK